MADKGRLKAYWGSTPLGTECLVYDVEHERGNPVAPRPVVRSNTPAMSRVAPNIVYRIVVKIFHTTADVHTMADWRLDMSDLYDASGTLYIKDWAGVTKFTAASSNLEKLTSERAKDSASALHNPTNVFAFITNAKPVKA